MAKWCPVVFSRREMTSCELLGGGTCGGWAHVRKESWKSSDGRQPQHSKSESCCNFNLKLADLLISFFGRFLAVPTCILQYESCSSKAAT